MRSVIQVIALVVGGVATAILLASMGSTASWIWGLLFGVLYPAIGLYQWSTIRKRGPESAGDAERLLGMLVAGQIGIIGLAASMQGLYAECVEGRGAPQADQRGPG